MIGYCMRRMVPHYKAYLLKLSGQPRFRALGTAAYFPFARAGFAHGGKTSRSTDIAMTLSGGVPATARKLRHIDRAALLKFLGGLSAQTCLSRGWSPLNADTIDAMGQHYLRRSCSLADSVLVLTAADELIGLAEYCPMSQEKHCELAVVIADSWQGRKAGALLFEATVKAAQQAGYKNAFVDISLNNARMLLIAQRLGFAVTSTHERRTQMKKAL
jgi:N-acetylglutamate synthase-like GNAT family acetyltransferase